MFSKDFLSLIQPFISILGHTHRLRQDLKLKLRSKYENSQKLVKYICHLDTHLLAIPELNDESHKKVHSFLFKGTKKDLSF